MAAPPGTFQPLVHRHCNPPVTAAGRPEKRIAMAKAYAEKAEPSILNKLDREIIAIRREIFLELQTIENGFRKGE